MLSPPGCYLHPGGYLRLQRGSDVQLCEERGSEVTKKEKHVKCSSHPAVQATAVTATYGPVQALINADMSVQSGAIHAIIGPNGSGKSTLLKALMGHVSVTQGEIRFLGTSLSAVRECVAYMPQAAGVDWNFPARVKDVALMGTYGRLGWLRRPGKREKSRAQACLATVGLSDLSDRHISALSGGQKQRVFVARLLAAQPTVALMDEPFAGVDIHSEQIIRQALQSLAAAGTTVLVVHHDLASISSFCDTATLLSQGHVMCSGPIDDVVTVDNIARAYALRGDALDAPSLLADTHRQPAQSTTPRACEIPLGVADKGVHP
ncbi:metal ABC transporter ATP-binding protein [Corynebacterium glucuronolyticum]|uniref:Metal ABC transporter ATP-binding protein n=1 Tax=Corynebacterium glucuronolyticum TaxID=39791 RepID=A0A7T4EF92_9CORY|nr:metal ABC transporter ATP-binding protein [Corynebacterium glucuronolyticum]